MMPRTSLAVAALVALGACASSEGPIGVHEVSPGPSAGEATGWLEVTNRDDEPGSMDGWTLFFSETSIPIGSLPLESGSFVVLRVGEELSVPFPDGPFELLVEDGDGREVQRINVPALREGTSFGRVPDDADNWQLMDEPTPGAGNG